MKYFVLINFLFIFFTGCTNKLPIPGSDNIESILIIPHKAINAYLQQGWEVLPMLGHHAHYSHMAVLEW